MKKLAQVTFLFLAILGLSQTAKAALLVEPVLGYNLGTTLNADGGEKYKGGHGAAWGGRLGYQNFGLQLGLDYLNSSIDMDDNDFSDNVKMNEWAFFAGYEFPILVRAYAGYIFSAQGDAGSVDLKDGTGAKFGIGFTGLPFVDINIEYRKGSFSEYKLGGTTFDKKVKYETIMIGVSVPFTI